MSEHAMKKARRGGMIGFIAVAAFVLGCGGESAPNVRASSSARKSAT